MTKLEELINEFCPNGVEYKRFDEACTLNARIGWQRLTKAEYKTTGDYMLITGTDFTTSYTINYDSCVYVSEDRYSQDSKIQIKNGDVLITKDGTLGKVAQVNFLPMPATLNGGVFVVRPKDNSLLPRYIMHFLLSDHFQKVVDQRKTGSTISHLTQALFSRLQIPVPPLPVQEEIVRILDSFTELTAELTANLTAEITARKKQYEYYRDSLLTTDFSNAKRGVILDMLSQPITDGPHTTPSFVEHGIPFLSAEAVFDGRIHFDKKRGDITPEFDNECCKKYKPQKGDIFVVKSGSTTGKVGYVDTDIRFNIWSPLAALRVNSENSDRFLFHLLQSTQIQSQVKAKASHGSQPNLSMRALEQFEVDIPPLDVQIKIANVLDNFDSICSDLKIGLPAEIEARKKQYEFYRDKLLSF